MKPPQMPRWLAWLSLAVVASGVVMMAAGAWVSGVTWDEKTHVLMLQTFFDQGWNVTPDALIDGRPDPGYIWGVYVYGPVAELVAHGVTSAMGLESLGTLEYTPLAYAGRHIGIALMAMSGIAAAGLTVRVITRSWRFATLASAVLASVPLWVGHGMFNIKDLPVATGVTIASLGIVVLVMGGVGKRSNLWGALALSIGAILAAGTRAAIGVPIAASLVVAAFTMFVLLRLTYNSWKLAARTAAEVLTWGIGALVAAYLALTAIYPKAFWNPFELAWQAIVVSGRFPFDEPVLTSGTWMEQPPPWTYLPLWFGAQLPLLVLAGATTFIALWVIGVFGVRRERIPGMNPRTLAATAVLLTQMLLVPAVAIAGQSNMYNGSRQFLFVIPAAATLTTLSIWVAAGALDGTLRRRWGSIALWSVVALGLIAPLLTQMRLFPYNYVALNAVASIQPVEDHWPTDYWRASSRDLMRKLPAEGFESCAYEQARAGEPHACSQEPMFVPFLDSRGVDAKAGTLAPGEYWVVRENQGKTDVPSECRIHDEITRPLWGQTVIIGQIMACTDNVSPQELEGPR